MRLADQTKPADNVRDNTQPDAVFSSQTIETYKQIRRLTKLTNPEITKEEIYERLLQPFHHEKVKKWSSSLKRHVVTYVCKYGDCGKTFTKTWNMLDHVRMHEGIKPFVCNECGKSFTQKGNLKKHTFIQHSAKSLGERKMFQCSYCPKSYTERYNLMAHMQKHK
eukprot:CAMPEP_0168343028 /NCGR_PEP_ID=MMETSP0213-20121227/15794_1 /TAXON_ID=151035 /ORGANISM="Euplotes harpa, Strain FSP1.4" /LENGTH=164 /DNA_ID=CAMNT_0008350135 /DNA_START=241 /DNA_END=736 /DNA_ORIENTATION=+